MRSLLERPILAQLQSANVLCKTAYADVSASGMKGLTQAESTLSVELGEAPANRWPVPSPNGSQFAGEFS